MNKEFSKNYSNNSKEKLENINVIAVALQYIFGKHGEIPKVIASGRGFIAKRIIEIAKKYKIPIKEHKPLAESLVKLNIGEEIPPQLWEAVAEILAQIYLLDANISKEQNINSTNNDNESK